MIVCSLAEPADSAQAGVTMKDGFHTVDEFKCHYVVAEPAEVDSSVSPLVLVHGFGVNSKHFRKNMGPIAAATKASVYAVDLRE